MKSPKKRDWENTIIEKLQHLKILMTIQEIGAMPKATYKKIIKEWIKEKAFEYSLAIRN